MNIVLARGEAEVVVDGTAGSIVEALSGDVKLIGELLDVLALGEVRFEPSQIITFTGDVKIDSVVAAMFLRFDTVTLDGSALSFSQGADIVTMCEKSLLPESLNWIDDDEEDELAIR